MPGVQAFSFRVTQIIAICTLIISIKRTELRSAKETILTGQGTDELTIARPLIGLSRYTSSNREALSCSFNSVVVVS